MNFCHLKYIVLLFFSIACTQEKTPQTSTISTSTKDSASLPMIKVELDDLPPNPQEDIIDTPSNEEFSYKIIPIQAPKGFGYDVFMGEKRFLHQPNIPAINGNKSFRNRKEAEKVAILVTNKIQKKIMPPSVSIKELDSLGINY